MWRRERTSPSRPLRLRPPRLRDRPPLRKTARSEPDDRRAGRVRSPPGDPTWSGERRQRLLDRRLRGRVQGRPGRAQSAADHRRPQRQQAIAFTDGGAAIAPGRGCESAGSSVHCRSRFLDLIAVDLGDRSDRFDSSDLHTSAALQLRWDRATTTSPGHPASLPGRATTWSSCPAAQGDTPAPRPLAAPAPTCCGAAAVSTSSTAARAVT